MLERWFLKTLINIAFDGKYPIGSDAEVAVTCPVFLYQS
jgi:hypothetical protein